MDPVTHGIAGALLGKGFFSRRQAKVAVFAATLGAVFPDIDVFYEGYAEFAHHDPLAIVKYHRAITHSFVGLPFFAALLAALTPPVLRLLKRPFPRLRDWESPPFWLLTVIYGVGIASHILLDGMTSFGTRMWFPLSTRRVAWDLLFIIDFAFTTIILAPQVIAWIYRDPAKSRGRAWKMWIAFTAGDLIAWLLTRAASYPFHFWIVVLIGALLAALFFVPAVNGWGFKVTRAEFCQVGTCLALVYLFLCALAHHQAMTKVRAFAAQHRIDVERIGALPIPPSLLDWGDAIRSPGGIYVAQFDLREKHPPVFSFVADSPLDPYIARAFAMPEVQLYWQFARFPVIHSYVDDGMHVVELGENRFTDGRRRSPQPFTYQVVFDDAGNLVGQGWLNVGMTPRSIRRLVPQQPVARPAAPEKNAP
ncbi:MAG TPA: metal-dependent hydrolase [Candidatus Aquilonibacter sp.]|nr:metal-dependent hydrolase [Candidatus Aquilonibacter sp.]